MGDRRGASGQLPERLNPKAVATGHQGPPRRKKGGLPNGQANGGRSAHQASGLASHAGMNPWAEGQQTLFFMQEELVLRENQSPFV